jgi:hypothetical protein
LAPSAVATDGSIAAGGHQPELTIASSSRRQARTNSDSVTSVAP